MACRALAKESGARMLHLKASNILACMVGQSEKLITGAFVSTTTNSRHSTEI